MSKPFDHAKSSAEKYGGKATDYLAIHEFIDSSKAALGDKRHRAATHNSWFIYTVVPRVFGSVIKNSEGIEVSVSQIAEDHVVEDYGLHGKNFIPTLADFLMNLPMEDWMDGGREYPPSTKGAFPQASPVTKSEKEPYIIKDDQIFDDMVLDGPKPKSQEQSFEHEHIYLDGPNKYRNTSKIKIGEYFNTPEMQEELKKALESRHKDEGEGGNLFFSSIASD